MKKKEDQSKQNVIAYMVHTSHAQITSYNALESIEIHQKKGGKFNYPFYCFFTIGAMRSIRVHVFNLSVVCTITNIRSQVYWKEILLTILHLSSVFNALI